ncbi:MAG: HEAT repeat domain-containing protein [Nitrospirota bacterium]|nr:HEAT repeat domain-containing protein [Nitrospirota bacterium]
MQKEVKQDPPAEELPPQIQEIMRNLVSAIRAVKLYPRNNPVYAQSVKKAFEPLDAFLQTEAQYPVGIQKTFFAFQQTPIGKDTQINKTIAVDLFNKGIREILFLTGLTEQEMIDLFTALSLSAEDIALRGGIVSILWEKGATHIKITESALDDVITTTSDEDKVKRALAEPAVAQLDPNAAKEELVFVGRTLVLGDIVADPRAFGATMLEMARETAGKNETVEDRLFSLYQDAARQIEEKQPDQSEVLFQGLAKSVLAMEQEPRDRFISTKLYAELDAQQVREQGENIHSHVPDELHEIVTGRYSKEWTVQQVSTLLQKTAKQKPAAVPPPASPEKLEATPLPPDLNEVARALQEYSPEELASMQVITEAGMESDIIEATVRTLIFLLPSVKRSAGPDVTEKEIALFSGVVHQLEDILKYLLKMKDYDMATLITRALHMPVDPAFAPRLKEGVRKAATREVLKKVIADIHASAKGTPEYASSYSYLSALEREATPVLLELLAEEKDRSVRRYLLDLLKDMGKNQIEMLGERLNDERWYFVRNIVSIIGESKADESIALLEKVAGHKNHQIRLEVIKGLLGIGGKKAAALLARFLKDSDEDIQITAVRGLGSIHGTGKEELQAVTEFVREHAAKWKTLETALEGIKTLARIGDRDTQQFLQQYQKVRWWRSRKPQEQLRATSAAAINEIQRRSGNA